MERILLQLAPIWDSGWGKHNASGPPGWMPDKETETCVKQIYGAMLFKHAIDAQIEYGAEKERALLKSSELFQRITNGVYTETSLQFNKIVRTSARALRPACGAYPCNTRSKRLR